MEYFGRAKQSKEAYLESVAKEKLETVLAEATIEKETNENYNNTKFLDNMLEAEDMTVNENSIIVNNYNFIIDREKLKILESTGETLVKITKEVQKYKGKNESGKYEAELLITIESNSILEKVEIIKPDGKLLLEITPKIEKIAEDLTVEFDEEYNIQCTTNAGKMETRKIVEKAEQTISSEEELAEFRDKVNSGLTYEGKILTLTRNLDLRKVCNEEQPWVSIGYFDESGKVDYKAFSGTFNGNNHIIDYLYINTESELSQGLFGCTVNATITNMVIGNNSTIYTINTTGAIVGYAINSKILYCGNERKYYSTRELHRWDYWNSRW